MYVSTALLLPAWTIVAAKNLKSWYEGEWCFLVHFLVHGCCTFWMILTVVGYTALLSSNNDDNNKSW